MIYTKELLLKGLLGLGVAAGATYGGWTQRDKITEFFSTKDEPKPSASAVTAEAITDLPGEVGLECNGWNTTATAENGVDCSKKTGDGAKNIKVKKDESTNFDVSTIPANSKIKLYKLTGDGQGDYNQGLKFVIEEGDIAGTDDSSSNKLEQFETYEVKQEDNGGEWKLTRKKKSWEEKRRILGLPDTCEFPETGSDSKTCQLTTTESMNKVEFEGKTGTVTGTGNLQISIASSTDSDFPLGFKFTLTPASGSTLTINRSGNAGAITLENGKSKEFKIKQGAQNKKQLTLEEAWTHESLAKKVNLTCSGTLSGTGGVDCTKTASTDNIKAKKDSTEVNVSAISGGKIKVYKTSTGETHNEGFKFVIEENDINGDGTNKLEQFETYEIKKDGDSWKLVRKEDAKNGIKKALGLDECTFPANGAEQECALDESKFKKINFDGKSVNDMTGGNSAKLKISKPSNNNDYGSFGYKFKLESEQEAKISNSLIIKANTNTEFKIKKGTSNSISLEKAWTAKTLGAKVGLECPEDNDSNKECTLKSGNVVNIDNGESNKKFTGLSKKTEESGGEKKVKFEVGEPKYNQGFKFTAESEICLQNGNGGSDDDKKIEAKGNSEVSYEIKEDNGTWYLTKKKPAPAA